MSLSLTLTSQKNLLSGIPEVLAAGGGAASRGSVVNLCEGERARAKGKGREEGGLRKGTREKKKREGTGEDKGEGEGMQGCGEREHGRGESCCSGAAENLKSVACSERKRASGGGWPL